MREFSICAVCEFCLQLVFEADPHACINYDKSVIAFHQNCYRKALHTEGWFSRFWEREKEKKNLCKKECAK